MPAVLIPLHRRWRAEGDAERRFASLTAALLVVALALTAAVELLAGAWVRLLVGGFSPEGLALTTRFVQVMALAMPASVVFNCLISVELSLGRPRLTSVRASVQNVGVMLGIAAMLATGHVIAIAWGFTLAFTTTVSWGAWTLAREGELDLRAIRPGTAWRSLGSFLHRLRAMVAQPIAEQGQVWLERILASASTPGTVAALDYARTLTESALYVVSQPIGLAVLADNAGRDRHAARRRVEALARPLLILAAPASAFMVLFAPDLVQVVFARGAFGSKGVLLTSQALAGTGAGLWAATLGLILVRQLNSEGRNGVAAFVLVQAYAANAVFNLALASRLGALGLGLGESVRGVVLLAGASLAVRCGTVILRLVAQVAPGCVALWLASVAIHACTGAALARLGLGALVCAVVVGATGTVLAPDACRQALAWIGRRMRSRPSEAA